MKQKGFSCESPCRFARWLKSPNSISNKQTILQIKLFPGFDHPCGTSSWSLLRAPDLCTGFHCERDNHKSELLTSCFRPISWQPQKRDNAEIAILMCALYGFKFIPSSSTKMQALVYLCQSQGI